MPGFLATLLLVIGVAMLSHSAYSTFQYRKDLKLADKPYTHIPLDIVLETLISLGICIVACTLLSEKLRPIKLTTIASQKSWDTINQRPSFATGNHRMPPQ
jgi:hypothetical protein